MLYEPQNLCTDINFIFNVDCLEAHLADQFCKSLRHYHRAHIFTQGVLISYADLPRRFIVVLILIILACININ